MKSLHISHNYTDRSFRGKVQNLKDMGFCAFAKISFIMGQGLSDSLRCHKLNL